MHISSLFTTLVFSSLGHVAVAANITSSTTSSTTGTSTSTIPTPSQTSNSSPINGTMVAPTFDFLFAGKIPGTTRYSVEGPYGRRDAVPFTGATFFDGNGTEVATIVQHSSSSHSLHPDNGFTYSDSVFTFHFEDDQSYVFVKAYGVGILGTRIMLYL
ncbi:hypothetical protein C8Q75DRAFT_48421 [Abortiporus biennis]|nr:hypothetical protein C8Q75DRAFT_48421 [Abortiporus biennis]